jgi:hypothetical protein
MNKDAAIIAELEQLTRTGQTADGFYTTKELADLLGVGKVAMARRLDLAKQAGRLEVVRVKRESLDGRMMTSPAYRILPA